jgi:hypothetical protein
MSSQPLQPIAGPLGNPLGASRVRHLPAAAWARRRTVAVLAACGVAAAVIAIPSPEAACAPGSALAATAHHATVGGRLAIVAHPSTCVARP